MAPSRVKMSLGNATFYTFILTIKIKA